MINNSRRLCENYNDQGYFVLRHYFSEQEIEALKSVILTFHARWKKDNAAFYQEEAFNSSVITGSEYLSSDQRLTLFNFISSTKMMEMITSVIPGTPVFMNTQLFFNPVNPQQKDFWHRDCQYDYDLEEQEKVTLNTRVVHCSMNSAWSSSPARINVGTMSKSLMFGKKSMGERAMKA